MMASFPAAPHIGQSPFSLVTCSTLYHGNRLQIVFPHDSPRGFVQQERRDWSLVWSKVSKCDVIDFSKLIIKNVGTFPKLDHTLPDLLKVENILFSTG